MYKVGLTPSDTNETRYKKYSKNVYKKLQDISNNAPKNKRPVPWPGPKFKNTIDP